MTEREDPKLEGLREARHAVQAGLELAEVRKDALTDALRDINELISKHLKTQTDIPLSKAPKVSA